MTWELFFIYNWNHETGGNPYKIGKVVPPSEATYRDSVHPDVLQVLQLAPVVPGLTPSKRAARIARREAPVFGRQAEAHLLGRQREADFFGRQREANFFALLPVGDVGGAGGGHPELVVGGGRGAGRGSHRPTHVTCAAHVAAEAGVAGAHGTHVV